MDGTTRYAKLLEVLGKHTMTGYCIYIKSLADINLVVLGQIIEQSYKNIEAHAEAGAIDRILWQTEK